MRRFFLSPVAGMVAASVLTFAPTAADACGFKRFNTGRQPHFSETYTASIKGSVLIYKDSVDGRTEASLRSAGYTVMRANTVDKAGKATVVLVQPTNAADFDGKAGVVLVEVVPEGTAGSGAQSKYVVRDADPINSRLATIAAAMRTANGV